MPEVSRHLLRMSGRAAVALVLAAGALTAGAVHAQDSTLGLEVIPGHGPAIALSRHEVEVKVDGALDEPVWATLPVHGDFFVTEPDTLERPVYETRVRLFYSTRGLHVGVEADQPAETLLTRLTGRDNYIQSRDSMSLSLDASGTGRYGFYFSVGLGSSIGDGTILPERQFSQDWDGPWRGASQVTETGWSAEWLIPWGTVAMPTAGEERRLGIYISRRIAYRDETVAWPGLAFTRPVYLSGMQPVTLTGVNPRQQYNFYPYVSATRDEVEGDTEFKAGADFFWRPSSNFQLNATVNPDFGAVESDDVIINLTATETFFPEKRLFFQEGQQIFNATPRADTRSSGGIGSRGSPYTMVNTRRIGGQPEDPEVGDDVDVEERDLINPVDLLGAAKVTGQIGSVRYGVLGAFEDDVSFRVTDAEGVETVVRQDGNNYGTARLLWESNTGGRYKGLGILTTAVQKGVPGDAYATGVDWHYYTENAKLKLDGQAITSRIDGVGRGYGGFMDFEYAHRQGISTRGGVEYFDDTIDLNDLGFLERNDAWGARMSHQRTNSAMSFARQNRFDIRGGFKINSDDYLVSTRVLMTDSLTLNSLHRWTFSLNYGPEQYDDLNSFGNGTYRVKDKVGGGISFTTNPARPLSLEVGAGTSGEDLGGQSWHAQAGFDWRPSGRVKLAAKLRYEDKDGWLLHQSGRDMTTFQARQIGPVIDGEFFLTARQQFRLSLQWVGIKAKEDRFWQVPDEPGDLIEVEKPPGPSDDFSLSRLTFQARYRWEIAPLSDLFIVYTRLANEAGALGDDDFGDLFDGAWKNPIGDFFVVKLRYRFGS